MKQLLLLTAALSLGIATTASLHADSAASYNAGDTSTAPPAPRPFQVQNEDGTVTTVTPSPRNKGRLQLQATDLPANNEPEPKVTFITNSAPREPKTGYYAGAMVGFNIDAFRGNNFTDWFSDGGIFEGEPNFFGGASSNMSLGPMAGLKFGYIWPFGDTIDQFENETGGIRVAGALETELLYFQGFHEYSQGGTTLSGDVDQITFAPMVNFLLKAYWGRSEVYLGPGVGIAMTVFDGSDGAPDEESLGDFAYQFILGYEFHMNEDWSFFVESKYFTIQDATYISDGDSSNVLLGIGVKRQLF